MSVVQAPVEVPLWRQPAVRWAAGLIALVIAINAIVIVVGAFVPEPSGPPSSSYATSSRGLAAYAELLGRFGHPVAALRQAPDAVHVPQSATLVLVDPSAPVGGRDIAALRRFVARGGHVIVGGQDSQALAGALAGATVPWSPSGPERFTTSRVPGVRAVTTAGQGSYGCANSVRPLVGTAHDALVCAARGGRVLVIADSSPLQNDRLGDADNAALGLRLAGPRARPIVFIESVHGFTAATGLSALPSTAWWAIGLIGLAALTYLAARWRRLGPPVAADVARSPQRADHVDALARALARAGDRTPATERMRAAVRAAVIRRGRLRWDADDEAIRDAATSLGVSGEDAQLLSVVGDDRRGENLTRLGRVLAGLRSERR